MTATQIEPPSIDIRNRRILVVDDNEAVHEAFRKVLNVPFNPPDLDKYESALFGSALPARASTLFELDSAYQGAEALEKVRQSLREKRPFAVAFVDVRMPPGWDGVETLYQLWQDDPALQAVICSAFSDYSWEQLTARLGQTDRLLILKKPFDNIEARQMACALTEKWNLHHEAERRMADLEASQQQYRKLAAENDQLYREAQRINRMKDDFLATVSHEMRTPLTSILGWAQLLLRSNPQSPSLMHAIKAIERNARAQTQLVEDLLDVSRIITGKLRLNLEPVDLRVVIGAALDAVSPALNAKHIVLQLDLRTDVPPTCGDAARLQQVVWNLVSNAVKFTPEQGRVDVSLRREGAQAVITVKDTGLGIARESVPHLFERFFQADSSNTRAHGGLGLGLSIVRHLVELHGGAVRAESAGLGSGAMFEVFLPIASVPVRTPEPPESIAASATRVETPMLNGLEVLIVEDEPDTRDLVLMVLNLGGARATAVASAEEALAAVERHPPALLVSDICMPAGDGFELIRELRRRGQHFPAIALTAYSTHDDQVRAMAEGFQRLLPKPVDPDKLLNAIAELAGRS